MLPAYAGMILLLITGVTAPSLCAPRVCGDDPTHTFLSVRMCGVLPAYAGMIPSSSIASTSLSVCSPRMRG